MLDTNLTLTLKDLIWVLSLFLSVSAVWVRFNARLQRVEDTKADKGKLQAAIDSLKDVVNDLRVDLSTRLTRIEERLSIRANKDTDK